jgi:hypothetical protein
MSILTDSRPIALGILALAACAAGAADAKECRWFGTPPVCDGECPRGWRLEQLSGKGCLISTWGISGTRAFCCKIDRCGPSTWGTEGCPYPDFQGKRGKSKRLEPPPLPSDETRTDDPLPSGKRQCPPGYRVLSSPNKYGAYCEQIPTTSGCPAGLTGPKCDQVIVK